MYFINNIINQAIVQFCFKSKLNNTSMNPGFKSCEFEHTDLTLNVHIDIF